MFPYVERRTKRSEKLSPLLLYENLDLLAESDLARAEDLSTRFRGVYFIDIVNNTFPSYIDETLATELLHVADKTILQLTSQP